MSPNDSGTDPSATPPSGAPPSDIDFGSSGSDSRLFPSLSFTEWVTFGVLAAVLAATNIYTTLLIGWGDTGSIVAVLGAVLFLGVFTGKRVSVHKLNLGQTMASAGGSVGFAVASYAAVYIVDPTFRPGTLELILLFSVMGLLGALVGSSVRQYMVRYFFPSGTACAVIQTSVARELAPGERNRPVWLLAIWGTIAAVLTLPGKITFTKGGGALIHDLMLGKEGTALAGKDIGIGIDPLYYGIGIVVGPRVGAGMLIGALGVPFLIVDGLAGGPLAAETGDWVKWIAIAVLTLPTFAAILFAYFFKTPAVVPPGFQPGRTEYARPASRAFVYGLLGVLAAAGIATLGQAIFNLPWHVTGITIAVAWPLCIVNGRVTGDTDINPVRLVAIVLLSAFFWLITAGEATDKALTMLGMAVVGGTLAATAVDMMQDYRTGYLVDANPTHQTSVQLVGTVIGAIAAIPVLNLLMGQLGIGPDSQLPAPGAQVWATMAEGMSGGFEPSNALLWTILITSIVGSLYAFLTVWPKTAPWMPSVFGIGIGMLVGVPASAAIFAGGLLKWAAGLVYTSGIQGAARDEAAQEAGNDTMLAGASVFAAGALVSILLVVLTTVLGKLGLDWFHIAV